jgi:hypothetical protein
LTGHHHTQKKIIFFFFFFFVCCPVAAHADGAGQCNVPADITAANAINGMAGRGRDGTNTVTVTPSSAAPGSKVQIKVDATDFIGVLGAVYAADAKVGTHTAPSVGKLCGDNADAITHSGAFDAGTKTLSWDYTLPAAATGTLEVRVITLNGVSGGGSAQKFALGKATITVSGSASGTTTAGGSDAPAASTTTKAGGSTAATTKASSASLVSVASAAIATAVAFLF